MTPAEFQVLQEQTAQYMQAHEGTTITLENIPGAEVYAKLKKASQMGEAPDAMLLDNAWIQEFAALGFLKPLDDRLSTEQQSQRIPSMMNQVKWNGYLWGIPRDVDPYVLIWNKKAAAEGKVEHAPLNREEMIQWNKTFLKPEEGRYGIYFDPSDNMALVSMVTSLMSQPTETSHPLQKLADPNLLKALQSFLLPQEANWNSKTYSVNYPAPSDTWKPWDLLAEGKITAMITTISEFRQHKGESWLWPLCRLILPEKAPVPG
ncbi:extracellular solute-binding protein [Paenibacillus sp. CC-CFT747]|nr:extracellular solute-binding protein [Paenibacillus sp. CC-CFT747]